MKEKPEFDYSVDIKWRASIVESIIVSALISIMVILFYIMIFGFNGPFDTTVISIFCVFIMVRALFVYFMALIMQKDGKLVIHDYTSSTKNELILSEIHKVYSISRIPFIPKFRFGEILFEMKDGRFSKFNTGSRQKIMACLKGFMSYHNASVEYDEER